MSEAWAKPPSSEMASIEAAIVEAETRVKQVEAAAARALKHQQARETLTKVDDLAYLYLDLASDLGLQDAVLVGACFGGWIAVEMMVRSTARFSNLVLVDPLGIKISGREERDIADMHGLPRAEYLRLAWADPAKADVDFTKLPESELAAIVRGREAFALYGWKPYMHNPRLKRWLHRIDIPTLLLWGAEDRIVTPAYGEGWRRAISRAQLEIIRDAGHFPHWEQPEAFVERLSAFVDKSS